MSAHDLPPVPPTPAERLEELRVIVRSESMSWGELAELQGMAQFIDSGDVELLEWAGVPEFPEEPTADELAEFTAAYIRAAFWSTPHQQPTDEDAGTWEDGCLDEVCEEDDLHPDALATIAEQCEGWIDSNLALLRETFRVHPEYQSTEGGTVWSVAGHDLWLTANGHGVGFWDRGLGWHGDQLTEAAKVLGETELYVGDDGKVHL